MDFRDNPKHLDRRQPKWPGFASPNWTGFTPPLTHRGKLPERICGRVPVWDPATEVRRATSEWSELANSGLTTLASIRCRRRSG
jgi:hypothetical protein